jgi:acyl dehydratase
MNDDLMYFEDLEPGAKASFGRYEVTREEVFEFASKYDPQPFHLSDEAAAQTHFGRISASGWHTCAMVMRMMVDNITERKQAGLGSPGLDELRWLRPVYPGDTLRVETTLLDKTPSRSRPEMGSFRSHVKVFNQDDALVATMKSIGLIRRRSPS